MTVWREMSTRQAGADGGVLGEGLGGGGEGLGGGGEGEGGGGEGLGGGGDGGGGDGGTGQAVWQTYFIDFWQEASFHLLP